MERLASTMLCVVVKDGKMSVCLQKTDCSSPSCCQMGGAKVGDTCLQNNLLLKTFFKKPLRGKTATEQSNVPEL